MSTNRSRRVAEAVKEELSAILRKTSKDPRIGFLSIVTVEVSGDLRHARAFVSVYGTSEEKKRTIEGLESARGFLRSELGQRLRLRHVPELMFTLDDSIAHGARINELLGQLGQEKQEEEDS